MWLDAELNLTTDIFSIWKTQDSTMNEDKPSGWAYIWLNKQRSSSAAVTLNRGWGLDHLTRIISQHYRESQITEVDTAREK